jgi:uncharacterized protein YjeT (DUF2065 family)
MTAPAIASERVAPPPLPSTLRGGRWHARAYGSEIADLDIHFGHGAALLLTGELLCACLRDEAGHPAAADTLATWTLARRLQALLHIRLAEQPAAQLPVVAACGACHAGFEFELELARFVQPQGIDEDPPPLAWVSPDGHAFSVRLPRAADLLAWQAQGLRSSAQLAAALVDTVDGLPPDAGFVIPEGWAEALADRLAEADPLTALSVAAACPECGQHNDVAVDLEGLLLAGFARQQRELLNDLARIAQAFHWSEAQILALPAWRRARYLAHIDATEAA